MTRLREGHKRCRDGVACDELVVRLEAADRLRQHQPDDPVLVDVRDQSIATVLAGARRVAAAHGHGARLIDVYQHEDGPAA